MAFAEIVEQMRLISVAEAGNSVQQLKMRIERHILPQQLIAYQRRKCLGRNAHHGVKAAFQLTAGQSQCSGYLADARAAFCFQHVVDCVEDSRICCIGTEQRKQNGFRSVHLFCQRRLVKKNRKKRFLDPAEKSIHRELAIAAAA